MTDRKRAAALRLQRRQREHLPLLASLIAEAQLSIDDLMTTRGATWIEWERSERDRRAGLWRKARRDLDRHAPAIRQALLDYWNSHRWLPGDPYYLLDMLHGFRTGRLILNNGQVCPARLTIPASEALAAFGRPKPVDGGWFGKRAG